MPAANKVKIPLLVPDMPSYQEVAPFLKEIDENRWYTNFGPLTLRLESQLRETLGWPTPEVVTVSNCTAGLEMCLAALQLPQGASVLLPALTFIATATAILRMGLKPVLADIDERSWLLTPSIARDSLSRAKISCVMPVAAFGNPVAAGEWDEFSSDTGIPVVIDAAGAFGNQEIGSRSATVFSFHATKSLGIGEGGMVASRNRAFIERVRRLSNFGIDLTDGLARHAGTNAKLSEYHAAVGLAALQRWQKNRGVRQKLSRQYISYLKEYCPSINLQDRPEDGIYTIMQVAVPPSMDRNAVVRYLGEMGMETRTWYLPKLSEHPVLERAVSVGLPVLDSLKERLLGLPFHMSLNQGQVLEICLALREILEITGNQQRR